MNRPFSPSLELANAPGWLGGIPNSEFRIPKLRRRRAAAMRRGLPQPDFLSFEQMR